MQIHLNQADKICVQHWKNEYSFGYKTNSKRSVRGIYNDNFWIYCSFWRAIYIYNLMQF